MEFRFFCVFSGKLGRAGIIRMLLLWWRHDQVIYFCNDCITRSCLLKQIQMIIIQEMTCTSSSWLCINCSVGKLFPPLPRRGERSTRSRNSRNSHHSATSVEQFFHDLESVFTNDLKMSFNSIRLSLNNTKKKVLKNIAAAIMHRDPSFSFHPNREQWYNLILDIIDTKLYQRCITTGCPAL